MPTRHSTLPIGEIAACVAASAGRVRLVRYPAAAEFGLHEHETSTVTLILRGSVAEDSPTRASFRARPGDCLLKPAGSRHSNVFGAAGAVTIQIELPPSAESGAASSPSRPVQGRELHASSAYGHRPGSAAARAFFGLVAAVRGGAAGDVVDDLISDALGGLASDTARPRRADWLARAERAIRERLPGPVRVSMLAETLGLHPVHVTRVFHLAHGCGVTEYVRRLRVQLAAEALLCRGASVCQAALDAGFFDQAHLTRAFGQVWGVTPGVYRRLAAGDA